MSNQSNIIYTPIGNANFVGGVKIQNKELTNQQFFDTVFTKYVSFTLPVYDEKISSHLEINLYSEVGTTPIKTIDTEKPEDRELVFGISDTNGFFNIPEYGFSSSYQGNPVFVNLQEYHQKINFISWKTSIENKLFYSVFPSMNIDNYGNGKATSGTGGTGGGEITEIPDYQELNYCNDDKITVSSNFVPVTIKTNTGNYYSIRGEDLTLSGGEFVIDISNALAVNNLSEFKKPWYVYFGGKTEYSNKQIITPNYQEITSCDNNKITVSSNFIPVTIKTNSGKFYSIRGEDLMLSGNKFIIDISNALAINDLSEFTGMWYIYFGGRTEI